MEALQTSRRAFFSLSMGTIFVPAYLSVTCHLTPLPMTVHGLNQSMPVSAFANL